MDEALPQNKDVLGYFYYLKGAEKGAYHKMKSKFLPLVVKKIQQIWNSLLIPIKSPSGIRFKVGKLLENYDQMVKRNNVDEVILNELFNIGKCQCFAHILVDITDEDVWCICKCRESAKIPQFIRPFFLDQLFERRMQISALISTVMPIPILEQPADDLHKNDDLNQFDELNNTGIKECDDTFEANASQYDSDDSRGGMMPSVIKNVAALSLQEVAIEADRRNLSNRNVAAIINSTLKAAGLITEKNRDLVIDQNKVHRERANARNVAAKKYADNRPLHGFYFDGKKDDTLCVKLENGQRVKFTAAMENITIIKEPGNYFLGFLSLADSTSVSIKNALVDFFAKEKRSLDKLIAIGSDGAATNTGRNGGVIRLMEEHIGRPVHWFICTLHLVEVVLKKVFGELNVNTKGPHLYAGLIGPKLNNCHTMPLKPFKRISLGNMPDGFDDISDKFTNDQKYLIQIALAVDSGACSENLVKQMPGQLNRARWLTTAARILRLYVAEAKPTSLYSSVVFCA